MSETESKPQRKEVHPIVAVVDRFVHYSRDTRLAAGLFIPEAARHRNRQLDKLKDLFEKSKELLHSDQHSQKIHGERIANQASRRLRRLKNSRVSLLTETSLFLGLFSAFDAFTGQLITTIFDRKPELFGHIKKTIEFAEILRAKTLDDVKREVLVSWIETFKRKSYVEQFESLESLFGIPLKAFDNWKHFVESTQRRNLFMHCDGIVSEQYRSICLQHGWSQSDVPAVGTKLKLGAKYFFSVCELFIEVSLKLGHTLWRKFFPEELQESDDHIVEVQYDALMVQKWDRAIIIGKFAGDQRKISDLTRRIATMNCAIAEKFGVEGDEYKKTLATLDWSASVAEFGLAETVLNDRFDDAVVIMRKLGPKGQFLTENSYHEWPLFRKFRESPQFAEAYKDVYGYAYSQKVGEELDDLQKQAENAKTPASDTEGTRLLNQEGILETPFFAAAEGKENNDGELT